MLLTSLLPLRWHYSGQLGGQTMSVQFQKTGEHFSRPWNEAPLVEERNFGVDRHGS